MIQWKKKEIKTEKTKDEKKNVDLAKWKESPKVNISIMDDCN